MHQHTSIYQPDLQFYQCKCFEKNLHSMIISSLCYRVCNCFIIPEKFLLCLNISMNSHSHFSFMFSSSSEFSQISWTEWKLKLVDQIILLIYNIFLNNWIHLMFSSCLEITNLSSKYSDFLHMVNVDSLHIIQCGSIFLIYPHITQKCIFSVKSQPHSFTICPSALNTISSEPIFIADIPHIFLSLVILALLLHWLLLFP